MNGPRRGRSRTIKTLERMRDWRASRLDLPDLTPGARDHMIAEFDALEWALHLANEERDRFHAEGGDDEGTPT